MFGGAASGALLPLSTASETMHTTRLASAAKTASHPLGKACVSAALPIREIATLRRPASSSIAIAALTPSAHAEWDEYVDRHPRANCYHLRAWQVAAQRAYRISAPHLVARRDSDGAVCGVLPLFVVDTPLRSYAVTGIFGAYGPILSDNVPTGHALLDAAWSITKKSRVSCLVHKGLGREDQALAGEPFECLDRWVTATLDLEGGLDSIWRGFRSEIRNRIRKAKRNGLVVKWGPEQLKSYYDVLAENMHRKGTPIYGYRFMRELAEALEDRAEVITLARGGNVIAGALVVYHRGVVNVPFVSSRPSTFDLCPSNLIYWEIIKRAVERGMRELDFGRSLRDSSNLQFKLRWGASTTPQPFFVRSRRNAPSFDQTDSKVRWLVQAWRNLPRPLADAIGPSICGRFLI